MASATLTPTQAQALFNILTHYEVYAEIQDLAKPETIYNFGYPFSDEKAGQASMPIQQMVMEKIWMKQPGVSSLTQDFWQGRMDVILSKIAEAGLSDSYEKGGMGIRKTVATASAVVMESIARGMLGGLPKKQTPPPDSKYDLSNAADLHSAFEDALQGLVYGDAIDIFLHDIKQSDKLEDQSPLAQAGIEYATIM